MIIVTGATGAIGSELVRMLTESGQPVRARARATRLRPSVDAAPAAGLPTWLAGAQLALAEYQRAGGPTAMTTDTVERLTGRRPRTIEEFAADHAGQLAPAS